MTTLALSAKSITSKTHPLQFARSHWRLIYSVGIVVVLFMLVYYAFLVNQITGQAYSIKNDNRTLESLSQENKSLEINFAKSDFLAKIMEQASDLSFEKTTHISYVQILENSVAVK